MSLWLNGPNEEVLDNPRDAPSESDRLPRLMRSVITFQFAKVACGAAHCMAITPEGRLYSWGWNEHGQCGLGDVGSVVPTPRAIGRLFGRTVGAVACGAAHTIALVDAPEVDDCDGCVVYAWGAQHAGQLGYGPKSKVREFDSPNEVVELRGIAGKLAREPELGISGGGSGDGGGGAAVLAQPLSCGLAHTALVSHENVLWTWGSNQHGQCGQQASSEGSVVQPGQVRASVCARMRRARARVSVHACMRAPSRAPRLT